MELPWDETQYSLYSLSGTAKDRIFNLVDAENIIHFLLDMLSGDGNFR